MCIRRFVDGHEREPYCGYAQGEEDEDGDEGGEEHDEHGRKSERPGSHEEIGLWGGRREIMGREEVGEKGRRGGCGGLRGLGAPWHGVEARDCAEREREERRGEMGWECGLDDGQTDADGLYTRFHADKHTSPYRRRCFSPNPSPRPASISPLSVRPPRDILSQSSDISSPTSMVSKTPHNLADIMASGLSFDDADPPSPTSRLIRRSLRSPP